MLLLFSYISFFFPFFLIENQEKFYWYLIAIVTATVLVCLILVIGRLIIQRRRESTDDTKAEVSNSGDTQLPNGFSDDISEIDADIDLQTSLPSGIHHNVNKHDVSFFFIIYIDMNNNNKQFLHNPIFVNFFLFFVYLICI